MQKDSQDLVEEDEIDLLDLFLVLLRYRKLIILPLLLALLLSIAGYFFLPKGQYQRALEASRYRAELSLLPGPALHTYRMEKSVASLLERPELLISIENVDLNLSDGYELLTEKESSIVTVSYSHTSKKMAEETIERLFEGLNNKALSLLAPEAHKTLDAYRSLEESEHAELSGPALAALAKDYRVALSVLDGSAQPVRSLAPVQLTKEELSLKSFQKSYRTKALVALIALIFLLVFFAFILNALSNVKNDPQAMEKIRQALGRE